MNPTHAALLAGETRELARWRVRHPGVRLDLRGADLRHRALDRADLRGADLTGGRLTGASFRDADLRHAVLTAADLRNADLQGAVLRDAALDAVDGAGASLRGADLRHCTVHGSATNFAGADLRATDLRGADLRGACLRGADLSDANLSDADLSGADLRRARLQRVHVGWAALWALENREFSRLGTTVRVNDADLSEADLSDADLPGASLVAARLIHADLAGAHLGRVDLDDADLSSARLTACDAFESGLRRAVLRQADLGRAFLVGADLTGSCLIGADLTEAWIGDNSAAGLSGADSLTRAHQMGPVHLDCGWPLRFGVIEGIPGVGPGASPPALDRRSCAVVAGEDAGDEANALAEHLCRGGVAAYVVDGDLFTGTFGSRRAVALGRMHPLVAVAADPSSVWKATVAAGARAAGARVLEVAIDRLGSSMAAASEARDCRRAWRVAEAVLNAFPPDEPEP